MEHYKRLKSIGKGTYGEAHLVQYLQDDRYYVMKKIDLSKLAAKQRLQAEREVAILSQLHHPYIIHYKESFIHDNSLCIVTSYAEQGDRSENVGKRRQWSLAIRFEWRLT
jgi:NIMA (never in mitosis gene a)-related kinase